VIKIKVNFTFISIIPVENFMNMNQIMKQAQQLQKQLQKKQEELSNQEYEASSGGGMVTVKINGKNQILDIKIDPEVVSPDDVEMLQDLVVAAINQAIGKVAEAQQDSMSGMMGGMGMKMPGMF
jgi:hypothetical protein